jgi:hypothetical protein
MRLSVGSSPFLEHAKARVRHLLYPSLHADFGRRKANT